MENEGKEELEWSVALKSGSDIGSNSAFVACIIGNSFEALYNVAERNKSTVVNIECDLLKIV